MFHRTPGSIGQRQTPGRVFQGKRMSGHMGDMRRTIENLQVVEIDAARNLLLIRGAVPGSPGGEVIVRPSVKAARLAQRKTLAPKQAGRQDEEVTRHGQTQLTWQLNSSCQQGGDSIEVSEKTFGREFNEALVHQVVTAYMAARPRRHQAPEEHGRSARRRHQAVEAEGRRSRPRRLIRSPIWVGGGRAFAARPRDFSQKVNRKMYRGAMRAMLSELARLERLRSSSRSRSKRRRPGCSRRSSRSWASTTC